MGYHKKYQVQCKTSIKICDSLQVLVYHVRLHSLAILGAPLIDVLSSLVRAHKADGLDGWVATDEVHRYTKIQMDNVNPLFICAALLRQNIRAQRPWIHRIKSTCLKHS